MAEWGYAFPEGWGRRRVPVWARLLFRVARFGRGVYWKYIRVARGARTPKLAPG
jgi:hypothetical protein